MDDISSPSSVACGVPQESVLGPLLFTIFLSDITSVMKAHQSIKYAVYADDIQVFIKTSVAEFNNTVSLLQNCLNDIRIWLSASDLALNLSKSEFMVFTSKSHTDLARSSTLRVNNIEIPAKPLVRNLEVMLDTTLT